MIGHLLSLHDITGWFYSHAWKHYQQIAQDMTLDQVVIPSYNSSQGKVIAAMCHECVLRG